ncbi:hypothetical protein R950_001796 [Salmonella enterica subsp. enterica]|nr:hypothetical protein [Salmonella enterica subsp. enterica serovar Langford]
MDGMWRRSTGDGKRDNFLLWCNHEKQKAKGKGALRVTAPDRKGPKG